MSNPIVTNKNSPCTCRSGLTWGECCGKRFGGDQHVLGEMPTMSPEGATDRNAPEVGAKPDRLIVKVQVPMFATQPVALAYTHGKTIVQYIDLTEALLTKMAGKMKQFFYARLVLNKFMLEEEAPWQQW